MHRTLVGEGHVDALRVYGPDQRAALVTLKASAPGGARQCKVRTVTFQMDAAFKSALRRCLSGCELWQDQDACQVLHFTSLGRLSLFPCLDQQLIASLPICVAYVAGGVGTRPRPG